MCTSFIKKTAENTYIAMNFDNNGIKYSINTRKTGWFIVYVEAGKTKTPSFGVHKSGIFFNNLCVPSNGKGEYRRTKGVIHTARLFSEIIDGKIEVSNLGEFLDKTEIVNVPGWSTHQMICDEQGNVYIIEPGRGNLFRELSQNEFQVMTNESLIDHPKDKSPVQCMRYQTVQRMLEEKATFDVTALFNILKAAKQSGGEWITDFSIVYDKEKETVYYCEHQCFDEIQEYHFS